MVNDKKAMPEEDELVLCKVTNIQYNSVFVRLQEYDNSGMIHISEISPGRIRNIRDYVKEGKIIVCKVLRINRERNQIDLSLRRVTEAQRRLKANSIKQEQICKKIIEHTAKNLNIPKEKLQEELEKKILKKYDSLYHCFEDVSFGSLSLKKEGLPEKLVAELEPMIKQRIKIPEVKIEGNLSLASHQSDGVEIVKKALMSIESVKKENIALIYTGNGTYKLTIKADNYKTAEDYLKKAIDTATSVMESNNSQISFQRNAKN